MIKTKTPTTRAKSTKALRRQPKSSNLSVWANIKVRDGQDLFTVPVVASNNTFGPDDSTAASLTIPVGQFDIQVTGLYKLGGKSLNILRAVAVGLNAGFAVLAAQEAN